MIYLVKGGKIMQLTESFLDQCAAEYFNFFNSKGVYPYQRLTFEQFVEQKKREIERVIK